MKNRKILRAGLLGACAWAASACVWDDDGRRIRSSCEAELDWCVESCADRAAGRLGGREGLQYDTSPGVDNLTCEPRCRQRFERCLDETAPAEDERKADQRGAPGAA